VQVTLGAAAGFLGGFIAVFPFIRFGEISYIAGAFVIALGSTTTCIAAVLIGGASSNCRGFAPFAILGATIVGVFQFAAVSRLDWFCFTPPAVPVMAVLNFAQAGLATFAYYRRS
jgi:hypothetical protein